MRAHLVTGNGHGAAKIGKPIKVPARASTRDIVTNHQVKFNFKMLSL